MKIACAWFACDVTYRSGEKTRALRIMVAELKEVDRHELKVRFTSSSYTITTRVGGGAAKLNSLDWTESNPKTGLLDSSGKLLVAKCVQLTLRRLYLSTNDGGCHPVLRHKDSRIYKKPQVLESFQKTRTCTKASGRSLQRCLTALTGSSHSQPYP